MIQLNDIFIVTKGSLNQLQTQRRIKGEGNLTKILFSLWRNNEENRG